MGTEWTNPRRVFVVGCYRSGTTLVERILTSHPDAVGLGFETAFFTHVLPRRRLSRFNERQWEEPLQRLLDVRSWREVADDPHEVFRAIASRLASERGASLFVEKTPFHLFHVEQILALDPEARILHVVRDGRDVVTSILGGDYPLGRWPIRRLRLVAACVLWELFVWEGHRLAPLEGKRFHTVRHEDIIRAPRAALERIAGVLDLNCSESTLADWVDRTREIDGNSSFQAMRGISDRATGRWREPDKLRSAEANLVNGLLAPTLVLAGYQANGGRLGLVRMLTARAIKLFFGLIRIVRFRHNTGQAPPRHIWSFLYYSARRLTPR